MNAPTERGLLNHFSGKGDKERGSGWRKHYDEIDFHHNQPSEGFARRGNKLVKCYGARRAVFVFQPVTTSPEGIVKTGVGLDELATVYEANTGED